jgi:hypothetical protein
MQQWVRKVESHIFDHVAKDNLQKQRKWSFKVVVSSKWNRVISRNEWSAKKIVHDRRVDNSKDDWFPEKFTPLLRITFPRPKLLNGFVLFEKCELPLVEKEEVNVSYD